MAEVPASPGGGCGSHESGGERSPQSNVREQDRYLPIANIGRIMKKGLPANAKIAKEAKDTVQECVSEFISFITSEASDKCQKEKRKTINGDDLVWSLTTLGFEDYIEPLKAYLIRHREMEGDTKGSSRAGDTSARNDIVGGQRSPTTQALTMGTPKCEFLKKTIVWTMGRLKLVFIELATSQKEGGGGDGCLPLNSVYKDPTYGITLGLLVVVKQIQTNYNGADASIFCLPFMLIYVLSHSMVADNICLKALGTESMLQILNLAIQQNTLFSELLFQYFDALYM
ncbi:hypothetical protein KY290_020581 [Solanum tuberosum]|uniref:Transcription factor CBF/NF-Y/archaeal histone domain-containing protein n=1 Tax=Solanum tuberosum TaxID=4113 RepID=A0ABQ7V123_SOLTU|nr:hypothetical protein KY290_020581 [Solanum tuberosum]